MATKNKSFLFLFAVLQINSSNSFAQPQGREMYHYTENGKTKTVWVDRSQLSTFKVRKVDGKHEQVRSPLVYDRSSGGRSKTLPGNLIVTLPPQWADSQADEWFSQRKLEVIKRFQVSGHMYLVKSSPGIASLLLASELSKNLGKNNPDQISVSPDWRQEFKLK